jgi:hypothetical protein
MNLPRYVQGHESALLLEADTQPRSCMHACLIRAASQPHFTLRPTNHYLVRDNSINPDN